MVLLEVCCTGIESALNMLGEGANRVELCSVLECGGLTPTWLSRLRDRPSIAPRTTPAPPASEFETPASAPESRHIDLLSRAHVLIRCRPGDFCYSQAELDEMCLSIRLCREIGVKGVVIGALTPEGDLDLPALRKMIHVATGSNPIPQSNPMPRANPIPQANPMPQANPIPRANPIPQSNPLPQTEAARNNPSVSSFSDTLFPPAESPQEPPHELPQETAIATPSDNSALTLVFHRAFDECRDPFGALEQIISLGFNTLLTSGQAPTAEQGILMLRQLVERTAGRINIMAGKGVTLDNVARIIRETGVPAVHLSEREGIFKLLRHIQNANF